MDLLLTYAHRRSCSILQRSREEDPAITVAMKAVLDEALGEDASHDFDAIDQTGCADPDRESAIKSDKKASVTGSYVGVSGAIERIFCASGTDAQSSNSSSDVGTS